jgi:hypothetical protein
VLHVLVPRALFTTGITDFSAELANPLGKFGVGGHLPLRKRANRGAGAIESDAPFHVLDVFLAQTGRCTVFARYGAFVTSLDTVFVFLVSHLILLLRVEVERSP